MWEGCYRPDTSYVRNVKHSFQLGDLNTTSASKPRAQKNQSHKYRNKCNDGFFGPGLAPGSSSRHSSPAYAAAANCPSLWCHCFSFLSFTSCFEVPWIKCGLSLCPLWYICIRVVHFFFLPTYRDVDLVFFSQMCKLWPLQSSYLCFAAYVLMH